MKTISMFVAFAVVVTVAGFVPAEDKPKKAEALLIEVTTERLALDFDLDAAKAMKKYDPKPAPPNTAGGTIIKITGPVEFKGGKVYFKNPTPIEILIAGAKPKTGGNWVGSMDKAKFKGYKNATITLEGEVKFSKAVGK